MSFSPQSGARGSKDNNDGLNIKLFGNEKLHSLLG